MTTLEESAKMVKLTCLGCCRAVLMVWVRQQKPESAVILIFRISVMIPPYTKRIVCLSENFSGVHFTGPAFQLKADDACRIAAKIRQRSCAEAATELSNGSSMMMQ
jgi:hypothetical protein